MSYRIQRRPDANQTPIIEALLRHGISVIDLADSGKGVADIVTFYRERVVFIELKCGKRAELKKTQVRFLGAWPGYSGIATTEEAAIALAKDPINNGLTDSQKVKLTKYHATMTAKAVHLPTILKVIAETGGVG